MKKYLRAPILYTQQWLGIAINMLFLAGLFAFDFDWWLIVGLILGWLLSVIGANLIAHRWVTHKHFRVSSKFMQHILLSIYNLNLIGSILVYASQHILHHRFTGDEGKDPHFPDREGFLLTHFRFYGARDHKLSLKYFRLLWNDPILRFYHSFYWLPIVVYVALVLIFFPTQIFYLTIVPWFVTFHLSQAQVTLTHMNLPGSYQNYLDTEQSKTSYNNWILKPFMLGEELHNNHHRYPGRANQGSNNSIFDYDILYNLVIKRFHRKKQR